eukprot:gene1070-3929_t
MASQNLPHPTSAIANGARVKLQGLVNALHLNGKMGTCKGAKEEGRYIIQLEGGPTIGVKRENIDVIPIRGMSIHQSKGDAIGVPSKVAWATNLAPRAAAEWFIDCYRMRLDDGVVYGCSRRGLYNPDCTYIEVVEDFLVFCHLAVDTGSLPANWDWDLSLNGFGHLLIEAFGKDDAREKYGRENFFSAMLGGRSLRATGQDIYGFSGIMPFAEIPPQVTAAELSISNIKWVSTEPLFEGVGGFAVWNSLLSKLQSVEQLGRHLETAC